MDSYPNPSSRRFLVESYEQSDSQYRRASLLWMAGIALLLVPLATLVDIQTSRWFMDDPFPGEILDTLDMSLIYAHTSGIFLILLCIGLLAPKARWHIPRLATLAMGAGAVATLVKMFILRPRPNSMNLDLATYDYAWIWSFDLTLSNVTLFDASTRAFPSAYLATATAFTVGLWVVVPRARWIFVALCVCTMAQRLYCGAHFTSDLFGSASIGLAWAFVCYHPSMLGRIFDKMADEDKGPRRRFESDEDVAEPCSEELEDLDAEESQEVPVPHRRAA